MTKFITFPCDSRVFTSSVNVLFLETGVLVSKNTSCDDILTVTWLLWFELDRTASLTVDDRRNLLEKYKLTK